MTIFHEYREVILGLFLVLCAFALLIFPPKFGNEFYGIRTKWTIKSEQTWKVGHKLFAVSTLGLGAIYITIGALRLSEEVPGFVMFALLIVLWKLSQYLVHKTLSYRYPNL